MPSSLYNSLLERLDGHPYSNYFACYCPFESHKSPALLVHDDGRFVCLSCGKKGTHKFLDKFIGSHFIPRQRVDTASRVLPRWRKWEEEYGDLEGMAFAAHKSLKRNPAFQTYFKKRKIYEYVDEGNLGYIDGWACFPVCDMDSKLCNIVVRSTSKQSPTRYVVHIRTDDIKSNVLYIPSADEIKSSQIVYVVFGIIDAISLHLAGLPVVTGITGKSLSPELLKPLHKRFVIVPDEGEEREAHRLANALGWRARVKQISYPDGVKDPDGIRANFGNTALLNLIGA